MIQSLLVKHGYDDLILIEALLHYLEDIDIQDQKLCAFYIELLESLL